MVVKAILKLLVEFHRAEFLPGPSVPLLIILVDVHEYFRAITALSPRLHIVAHALILCFYISPK
jgi:hypothetical protein